MFKNNKSPPLIELHIRSKFHVVPSNHLDWYIAVWPYSFAGMDLRKYFGNTNLVYSNK